MQATRASVDKIVASLVPLAHQAIGDTRHFVVESSSNPMTMMVDVAQLTSAVVNLVINARDATDAGATITLRTDSVPASDAPGDVRPGDYVVFRVSDNGKGVDPTIASRIFDPYFTTKPRGSGSGLGLATVSSFARQSGGAITLDNHPGQGATFNLYIPLSAPDAPTDIATVAVAQSRRVLVVDDESPLGALLTSWLIDSGVEARFVSSPEAALREFKEFAPDTLLTDVQLGSAIDGRELASRLLFVDPDLKLVFMTGFSDDMSILQERGLAVLGKPFTRDELLEVLAVLPSNHKGAHPQ